MHVHSPASHGFRGDYNQFIIQLGNADCDVIGINDYFSVEGYREVVRRLSDPAGDTEGNAAYRDALEKLRTKVLLPVVECRMTNVLVNKKGAGQRINFHLIFDPAVDPQDIEAFIRTRQVKDKTIGTRYADSQFLLEDVAVDYNATLQALQHDGNFRDRFLVWLPYDEYGGADGINPNTDKMFKENLIYQSDTQAARPSTASPPMSLQVRSRRQKGSGPRGSPAPHRGDPPRDDDNLAFGRSAAPIARTQRRTSPNIAEDPSRTIPRRCGVQFSGIGLGVRDQLFE